MILDILFKISDVIWVLLVPILLTVGVFFTVKTFGVQFKNFPDMIRVLGHNKKSDSISGLQAFFVGLASRVGTGNIAGVAIAVATGGPGAVFWMWLVALLGSASAFIESTLAQLYKVEDQETKFRGGPAYYISRGVKSKPLAFAFAISITIAFGLVFNAVQANTIATSLQPYFSVDSVMMDTIFSIGNVDVTLLGLIMAVFIASLVAISLFAGAKFIARLASIIVPIMASMYILLAIVVIIFNISYIDDVFSLILKDAFTGQALAGGAVGAVIMQGVKRGLFSNEAGMGSAPNAAASADVDHPVTQGLIQSLGVFVDTLVVCTVTAFIILLPYIKEGSTYMNSINPYIDSSDGILITQTALSILIGQAGLIFLTIAIFFFAFSSILGNYFYSQSNLEFMIDSKKALVIYKLIVIFMVVFGTLVNATTVWALADLFMGIMALINIFAIVVLHKKALLLLKDFRKQRKEKIEPVFNSDDYEEFSDIDIWSKTKN